ncbi:NAD-glutamate dehydrogenase [Nakamurella flavida]|uniref:NAD-glutamate dehydrogenase n=2 Tax=Nakamurella flavida TaxID=363630 RepID=UPI0030B8BB28
MRRAEAVQVGSVVDGDGPAGAHPIGPGGRPDGAGRGVREAAAARPELASLIDPYFRHIPPEDQPARVDEVLSIVEAHRRTGLVRQAGVPALRVHNPPALADRPSEDDERPVRSWSATSTVVDLVTDDMPHLVETVIAALASSGLTVHRILHPILSVRRDPRGRLIDVLGEGAHGREPGGALRESWMHILVDRLTDAERAEAVEVLLLDALAEVRAVVQDAAALTGSAATAATDLRATPSVRSATEVIETADLLYWLISGNVTFLGYRRHEADPESGSLQPVRGSGLGILRDPPVGASGVDPAPGTGRVDGAVAGSADAFDFADSAQDGETSPGHLLITRASTGSALTQEVPPLAVVVRILGSDGSVVREHRFLGVLTPRALNAEITTTPVLRRTVEAVLASLGAAPDSYTGERAMDLLSSYPRADLFWAEPALVADVVAGVLQLASRRRLRAFLQPDPFGRFVSVLVYLPRDRYTTDARLAMQQILLEAFDGTDIRYAARVGDSPTAALHFTVTTDPGRTTHPDPAALTEALRRTIRTWEDRLVAAVVGGEGAADLELDTAGALARYADAFDGAYKEDYGVEDAVEDLRRLDALDGPDDLDLQLADSLQDNGARRLKLYVTGGDVTLSRALPVLQSMGADVLDEQPYEVRRTDGTPSRIYDFGLLFPAGRLADAARSADLRSRFSAAFIATWRGQGEVDGFNGLVLAAGLTWREVGVLRSYAHYLRQIGTPYTQRYVEQAMLEHPEIAAGLVALFGARFDPDRPRGTNGSPGGTDGGTDVVTDAVTSVDGARPGPDADVEADDLATGLTRALDEVSSLDADRILRGVLAMVTATVRTNAYRRDARGERSPVLALKLDPRRIPGVPHPVPAHEIWVSSPRLEGVHLRFGAVARGGLRWSDRPEDFRTEVLGLVKAQEVKNAVIVPVGAKGGFVLRRPPAPTGDPRADREALQAEGIACYQMFIAALLDVTDNRVGQHVVPPQRVVRRDGDDPYLVVAADKGTATFSDTANAVAAEYGFWLGDAFASGGSVGYDHKAMGITARGAWESVRHHFRDLGIDTQTQEFTVAGIGDMSGDVFGNGMLLSPHIRLVAAFDHRHVFLDPDPDAAASFAERARLFALPRSSWADYDTALLSPGGGVHARTEKSVPLAAPVRAALGLADDVLALSPADLIRAILTAPVDLLWNGGIGTYVKASTETNADIGDKANDPVRVDGSDLRARVVGEGGNLGVSQLGRIEFSRAGGLINTDAIDNSAGVDTSDHEVNIKIALQDLMRRGELDEAGRQSLLVSMTDEVGTLVLADNVDQNRVLGVSRAHAGIMVSVHGRLIDALVQQGRLDRKLEFLPPRAQLATREAAGEGLSSPELAVLLAYVKSALSTAMLASDLPDEPAFAGRLPLYFPTPMRGLVRPAGEGAGGEPEGPGAPVAAGHPLAREIVTTMTVNQLVNAAGLSFVFRLGEEMAAEPVDAIRAFAVAADVFRLPELWAEIAAQDNLMPAAGQNVLFLSVRRLLDRVSRWLLTRRPQPLDVLAEGERYRSALGHLVPRMPRLLREIERTAAQAETARLAAVGAPAALATRLGYALYSFSLLDVIDIAGETGRDLDECADLYYALSAHLDFDRTLLAVTRLDRTDRWRALARQALRDDLYRSIRMITADVISSSPVGSTGEEKIARWERENAARLARARTTLAQLAQDPDGSGLAALSVAAREIRTLIR